MSTYSWLAPLLICFNLVLLPYFLLTLVSAAAAFFAARKTTRSAEPRSRFLIVIPAHDEEAGIAETVRSCLAVEYPADLFEVLVIADNCTDDTAGVAGREGATVVERHDLTRKSKGYAIEYLIERLQESGRFDSLDALIVVDADSTVSRDLLLGFAAAIEAGNDWVQCFYAVSNPGASWRTKLMAYAFCLFNGVGPLGRSTLGLSAGLCGNGMCLTTEGLRRVPWSSFGLVEDFEFSWNVRVAGEKIAFLPWTAVHGVMLKHGGKPAASQRQRWESGRREVARRMFNPLLRSPRLGTLAKLAAIIELTTPPMVRLLLYYLCVLALNVLLIVFGGLPAGYSAVLIGFCALMSLAIVLYGIAPFLVFGLSWEYMIIFFYIPFYAVWKLLTALGGKPSHWVRTPREQAINQ
jgi:cellulose synthase/poly-beta-1,6-N-acetylglucosamine synthase-like glycosyltransferase